MSIQLCRPKRQTVRLIGRSMDIRSWRRLGRENSVVVGGGVAGRGRGEGVKVSRGVVGVGGRAGRGMRDGGEKGNRVGRGWEVDR